MSNKISKGEEEISNKYYDFYQYIEDIMVNELTGRILTIIDGSITNERQNKSVKDQIKREIRSTIGKVQTYASDKDSVNGRSWGGSIEFPKQFNN